MGAGWFSFHGGHSGQFCRHARGRLEEVVLAAIDRGFSVLGLTEHCPRVRDRDLFPNELARGVAGLEEDFSAYLQEAQRLQAAFSERLEILVGFETEAVPADHAARTTALRARGFEYLVGSVHHVRDVCIDGDPAWNEPLYAEHGKARIQSEYFLAVAELVQAVRPEVVGHLDLIRKFEPPGYAFPPEVQPAIATALDAVADCGGLLEVNAAAWRRYDCPPYPDGPLLEAARARGIPVTLGDDSHGPHDVGVGLDACVRAIASAGYDTVHRLRRGGSIEAVPLSAVGS